MSASSQLRQQDDQDDSREVLHNEHAKQDPAMRGGDLAPVEERLEDHHGAADRDDAAEEGALRKWPTKDGSQSEAGSHRQGHLHRRAQERDVLDAGKVLEGELDTQGEHQEDHPDLGQGGDLRAVADEARGKGADHHPGQQVAHDHRLAQPMGQEPADEGDEHGHGDVEDEMELCAHTPSWPRRTRMVRLSTARRGPWHAYVSSHRRSRPGAAA